MVICKQKLMRRTVGALVLVMWLVGCHDPEEAKDASDYFSDNPSTSTVSDPIEFTDEPYEDLHGEMTIAELREIIPQQGTPSEEEQEELEPGDIPSVANVWFGFSPDDPFPVDGDCNPQDDRFDTIPSTIDELPATIEGVVTLHPRYFSNLTMCGTRERYYGTYVIQDETGGIQVFKDSRVAEFDVGDRVRLRVRGVTRTFGTTAIIAFDEEEVLNERDEREAVYYQPIVDEEGNDRQLLGEQDVDDFPEADTYTVRRMVGEVIVEATNQNFNEMQVRSVDNPDVEWFASLDREIGNRGVAPPEGSIVELTGPILDSFEMRMVIGSLGQMRVLEDPPEEQ